MDKEIQKKQPNPHLRKPMVIEPGKRYKGSAMINEYGEIEFRPYQEAEERNPRFRSLRGAEGDTWRIMTSKDKVRLIVTVDRLQMPKDMQEELRTAFLTALTELKAYEL